MAAGDEDSGGDENTVGNSYSCHQLDAVGVVAEHEGVDAA